MVTTLKHSSSTVSLVTSIITAIIFSSSSSSLDSPSLTTTTDNTTTTDTTTTTTDISGIKFLSFTIEAGEPQFNQSIITIPSSKSVTFRIFTIRSSPVPSSPPPSSSFSNSSSSNSSSSSSPSSGQKFSVAFTTRESAYGTNCDDLRQSDVFPAEKVERFSLLVTASLLMFHSPLYFCVRRDDVVDGEAGGGGGGGGGASRFVHQGTDRWLKVGTREEFGRTTILPLWLQIIVIIILLIFSGLFSGLNLGLMSLDQTELNIMIASGTETEKKYARTIKPLRKRGNYLLCSILLGNVLVNNCLTILLDDLTGSGWTAIVGATLAIVICGEIIPQAVCSRYGLAVGAKTIWFTKFFMLATFPLSLPISLVLDCILGEEINYVYNRDRLRELLKLTEKDIGLQSDEFNIITGALEMSKKTVADIMTKIENVFMIEYNGVLDFDTMTKIMESGYTRIPVYENDRSNIVALLNTKDLAFVDPDDQIPLNTVTKFYNHPVHFVFDDVKLDVILQDFKKGGSHMAIVQRIITDEPGDPYYRNVGLVTLEDVIEEIIQSEIYDEFDTVTDNITHLPRKTHQKDYRVFNKSTNLNYPHLSPQLRMATFQFLSATLIPFRPPHMTERILHKLLSQNIIINYKLTDGNHRLFQAGKMCDYFILIVQGRVEVKCGRENLTYETGSFSYFGLQALLVSKAASNFSNDMRTSIGSSPISKPSVTILSNDTLVLANSPFVPDYNVRPTTDLQYLRLRREQYAVAWRASQLEQELMQAQPTAKQLESADETFEREWRRASPLLLAETIDFAKAKRQAPHIGSGYQVTQGNISPPFQQQQQQISFLQNLRKTLGLVTAANKDDKSATSSRFLPASVYKTPSSSRLGKDSAGEEKFQAAFQQLQQQQQQQQQMQPQQLNQQLQQLQQQQQMMNGATSAFGFSSRKASVKNAAAIQGAFDKKSFHNLKKTASLVDSRSADRLAKLSTSSLNLSQHPHKDFSSRASLTALQLLHDKNTKTTSSLRTLTQEQLRRQSKPSHTQPAAQRRVTIQSLGSESQQLQELQSPNQQQQQSQPEQLQQQQQQQQQEQRPQKRLIPDTKVSKSFLKAGKKKKFSKRRSNTDSTDPNSNRNNDGDDEDGGGNDAAGDDDDRYDHVIYGDGGSNDDDDDVSDQQRPPEKQPSKVDDVTIDVVVGDDDDDDDLNNNNNNNNSNMAPSYCYDNNPDYYTVHNSDYTDPKSHRNIHNHNFFSSPDGDNVSSNRCRSVNRSLHYNKDNNDKVYIRLGDSSSNEDGVGSRDDIVIRPTSGFAATSALAQDRGRDGGGDTEEGNLLNAVDGDDNDDDDGGKKVSKR